LFIDENILHIGHRIRPSDLITARGGLAKSQPSSARELNKVDFLLYVVRLLTAILKQNIQTTVNKGLLFGRTAAVNAEKLLRGMS